jgi:DNA-directed RNA polymerase subunit RPC12/RpoP
MDSGSVKGRCANCGADVFESESVLDDAYAVYRGRCPQCNAVNLLGGIGRGYGSQAMELVLPTDHEVEMNGWEKDIPTRPCDCPACSLAYRESQKPKEGGSHE